MKSNLSQILCSINKNDLLSMVLLQQIKTITENFYIVFTVDFSALEKTFIVTPIDKDGEIQKEVALKIDDAFYTLKTKQRDLYLVLLIAKITSRIDQQIYKYYSYVFNKEDQYVNLLLLALSQSEDTFSSIEDNIDLFEKIMYKNITNISSIKKLDLKVEVREVELILSDDLYRYIGYNIMDKPCKGLKTPYEKNKLFGYPLKVSVDKDSYLDFFTIKINNYKIYQHITVLDMKPCFYLPLHIFEPITCEESVHNAELIDKGYTLFNYQEFIEMVLNRIFQAINLLNSRENISSPMWIKNHHKSTSLPFAKELLSYNHTNIKHIT